mmetsp:Transcript_40815/g.75939  ORF Transcript_40815/g.75939 Transcript_40815/m.75939 type:complete len:1164 (-) Transcript_40815:27-3518(-)
MAGAKGEEQAKVRISEQPAAVEEYEEKQPKPEKKKAGKLWKATRTKIAISTALAPKSSADNRSGDNILIENELNNMPIFKDHSSRFITFLAQKAIVESHNEGSIICKQGSPGSSLIMVLRGSVDMLIGDESVQTLYTGHYFGEANILGLEQSWSVTLCARSKCETFEITRQDFQVVCGFCKEDGRTFEAIVAVNRSFMMDGTLVKTCKILNGLSEITLHDIDLNVVRRLYFPGEKILQEGAPGDEVYILVHGRANVEIAGRVVRSEGISHLAGVQQALEDKAMEESRRQSAKRDSTYKSSPDPVCFGELGFFGMQHHRTASVVAQTVCQVRVLFRSVFLQKLQDHGESLHLQDMSKFMAERYDKAIKAPTVALREVKLFQQVGCSNEFLDFVAQHLEDRVYLAGQKILDEHSPEDKCMYLLGHGIASVMKHGMKVRLAREAEVFGEIALLGLSSNDHWTVVAVETCYTQVLHQSVIIRGLELFPEERQKVLMMAFKQADDLEDDDHLAGVYTKGKRASIEGQSPMQSPGGQSRTWKSKTHAAVMRAMQKSQLFSGVSHAFLDQLGQVSIDRIYMPGDLIMEEGRRGDSMFIMVSGTAGVFVSDPDGVGDHASHERKQRGPLEPVQRLDKTMRIGMLTSGSVSGELAMLGVSSHRSATIQAETLCSMWEITQDNALSILSSFPDAQNHFANIVLDRLERTAPARILALPLFQNFDRKFRMLVGLYCEKRAYFPGQPIVRESRTGEGMYVVNMGRATLDKQGVTIKTYSPGDTFGSTIMLGVHKKVIASLLAIQTCHILILSHTSFGLALEKYPCHANYVEFKQQEITEYDDFRKALQRITARKLIWKRYQKIFNHEVSDIFQENPDGEVNQKEILSKMFEAWKKFAASCSKFRAKEVQRKQRAEEWVRKAREARDRRALQDTAQRMCRNADARYPTEIYSACHTEFDANHRSPSPHGDGSDAARSPSPDAVGPIEDSPKRIKAAPNDPYTQLPKLVDPGSARSGRKSPRHDGIADRDYLQELAYGSGQTPRRRGRPSPRKVPHLGGYPAPFWGYSAASMTPRLPNINARNAGDCNNNSSLPQESASTTGQVRSDGFANMDGGQEDEYNLANSCDPETSYAHKLDRGLPFSWDPNASYLPLPAHTKVLACDRSGCTRILWQGAGV